MLLGRGISGASGDKGREVPKNRTAVDDSVHHLPPFSNTSGGFIREKGPDSADQLAATGVPMLTSLGEPAARIGFTMKKAVAATARFAIVATTKTACQPPV